MYKRQRLLSDVGIISIQQNVGSVVASRARALEYIEHAKADTNLRAMKTQLQALIAQRDQLNQQISDTITRILDLEERFRHSDQFRTYEFSLEADSPAVGTSIGALGFRQKTGATIIAVSYTHLDVYKRQLPRLAGQKSTAKSRPATSAAAWA